MFFRFSAIFRCAAASNNSGAVATAVRKGRKPAPPVAVLPDGRKARRTPSVPHLTGWTLFLREQFASNPALLAQHKDFAGRSKAIHALWTGLSAAERELYNDKAKSVPIVPHAARSVKNNGWSAYIKANYASVKKLPFEKRLGALRKKFEAETAAASSQKK